MPSSPGTRKRQQEARRAALSESATKRAQRKDTAARKKARKELDAAERHRIRCENTAARRLARLKLEADEARLIRMQARYRARQGEKKRDKRLAAGVAAGQQMLDDCEAQAKLAQVRCVCLCVGAAYSFFISLPAPSGHVRAITCQCLRDMCNFPHMSHVRSVRRRHPPSPRRATAWSLRPPCFLQPIAQPLSDGGRAEPALPHAGAKPRMGWLLAGALP